MPKPTFGMGVDVPNVDMVVRIGCPPSVEELIQEFGRAGRDGRQAKGEDIITYCIAEQHCESICLSQESCYSVRAIYSMLHVYWCKDKNEEDQQSLLRQFQEVWRYVHHIPARLSKIS